MKVSDLAAELEVPTSAVLEQCQRFSIDAAWAGAELSGTDVVILRTELAGADAPLDLTEAAEEPDPPAAATEEDAPPVDAPEVIPAVETTPDDAGPAEAPAADAAPEAEPDEVPAPKAPAPLPPTAVGSMPELIDEVTPDVHEEPMHGATYFGEATPQTDAVAAEARERNAARAANPAKHLDPSARNAPIVLVVGVALFAASNYVDNFFAVAALWLAALVLLVLAVVAGIRGRRHALTHPERVRGVWLGTIAAILAVAALVGVLTVGSAVPREQPASEAPFGVGDLASVQSARWGYQRLHRMAGNGFKQPARREGTCWIHDEDKAPVENERVLESRADAKVLCKNDHEVEVFRTFNVNRDADAPYPGVDGIVIVSKEGCGDAAMAAAAKAGVTAQLVAEYPTAAGWDDGDHDISCLLVTSIRKGALVD